MKRYNKLCAEAKKSEETYLGPTPLSEFICTKCTEVAKELDELIVEDLASSVWLPLLAEEQLPVQARHAPPAVGCHKPLMRARAL